MQRFVVMYEGRGRAPEADIARIRDYPEVRTFCDNGNGSLLVDVGGSEHVFRRFVREREDWAPISVVSFNLS